MSQSKSRLVGVLLLVTALWTVGESVSAQSWHPKRTTPDDETASAWQPNENSASTEGTTTDGWRPKGSSTDGAATTDSPATEKVKPLSWQSPAETTDTGTAAAMSRQASVPADSRSGSVDWQNRILKRPQPLQRPAAHRSDNYPYQKAQKVNHEDYPERLAQRPNHETYPDGRSPMFNNPSRHSHGRVARVSGEEVVAPGEVVNPGRQHFQPVPEGDYMDQGGCESCGGAGCDACGCAPCGAPACGDACNFGYEVFDGRCGPFLRNFTFFVGGDGFKGPVDRGTNGNFGLHEGLNYAAPLGDPWGCGFAIGANAVQSNFSGANLANTALRAAARRQYFVTASIFQRAPACGGLQWGVAFDYLSDNYYENYDLKQLRSETAWVIDSCYEIGYYGAYGVGTTRTFDGKLDPTDMFALFIRRNFETGGDGRIWGGVTGNGDGLIGADIWLPLGKSFAVQNEINYLIPKQGSGTTAQGKESWGLMVQLVFYPGQLALCQHKNPYRPIFNVADNSLFMVDRLSR